ncbi:PC4 and SFRS1-interacting protein-like [Diorhabda carinulata]|uniref:PC4 and SFRS1-interacting protein-like n=1 Tax=Diorhabda carinulata TaxID=1163345 RepID=UPI0025A19ADF|nr:PC4 and SFRS1-interacting protein-like [Diorhabda carinulata]
MKKLNFKVGDKVFAKVKGYPPWPARIVGENGKKYNVEFYGTGETGSIKSEDLFYYLKNKEKFQKPLKRKDYIDAFEQINEACKIDGGDGDDSSDKNDESENTSTLNTTNEKSEKKMLAKRKRSLLDENVAETSTPKKKSTRLSRASEENKKIELTEELEEAEKSISKKSPKSKSPKTKEEKKEQNLDGNTKSEDVKEDKVEPQIEKEIKKEEIEEVPKSDDKHDETEELKEQTPEVKDSKLEIVAEKVLRYNLAYANHVKQAESYYKGIPMEPRDNHPNQVLAVKFPSGAMGAIKLHLKWPLSFENEYECAIYDETVANRVLETKKKIESGDDSKIVDNAEIIIPNIERTEDEIKQSLYMKDIEAKKVRIERLNLEADLLGLDVKIKNCLGLDKADPKEAIRYLEEMCELNFDDIVLKKHLHIVEMVRRLRKYVGNTMEWNMNDESLNEFTKQAETIREMAEKVYAKFQNTVKLPENSSGFFEGFTELVNQFRADCKELELTETEIFILCAEPRSRIAFLNRLEEKENEKENTEDSNITSEEQEKVVNGTTEVADKTS